MRTLVAVLTLAAWTGGIALAQTKEARAKAMVAKWAGSDDTDALLADPAVKAQLTRLLGKELAHLKQNLDVRGSVDLISGVLALSGNATHGGGEEEAVVCIAPMGPVVQAAILSKGVITAYAADGKYDSLLLCIKDWITQANSKHDDRFQQPKNVRMGRP